MKRQTKKQTRKTRKSLNSSELTFLEHLIEFKNRFFVWLLFLILFSGLGYFLYPELLEILTKPLGRQLYYTSPTGGFEAVFNVSLFFGLIISLPVLLYQMIKFLKPSIERVTNLNIFKIVCSSFVLAILGVVSCYYLILPPSLRFLSQFGGNQLTALISTNDYFSFVIKYLLSFAIIFQMPLVLLVWNTIERLDIRRLVVNFRYILLVAFIVSAVLTPTPDLINQTIMATPILFLYLVSVLLVWINQKMLVKG